MSALHAIALAILQGDHRALSDQQPRACGDRAAAARLADRPALAGVLALCRGAACRHRGGALALFLARVAADRAWRHWRRRPRSGQRAARAVADRRRHPAGGGDRVPVRKVRARALRLAADRRVVSRRQRVPAAARRLAAHSQRAEPAHRARLAYLERRTGDRFLAVPCLHPRHLAFGRGDGRRPRRRPPA